MTGEALAAVCALSGGLEVISRLRQEGAQVAYKVQYSANGDILSKEEIAATPGTTIIVRKLFQTVLHSVAAWRTLHFHLQTDSSSSRYGGCVPSTPRDTGHRPVILSG